MQRRDTGNLATDGGATFFSTGTTGTAGANTLQEYQYRIGGRFFISNIDISQHPQFKMLLMSAGLSVTVGLKVGLN
jgi:hypothetical protein